MNASTRKTFTTLALVGALMGMSGGAQASETLAVRVATGVGHIIAEQGNAALVTIREELRDKLLDTLAPILPGDAAPKAQSHPASEAAAAERVPGLAV